MLNPLEINLSSGWTTLWNALPFGSLKTVLTAIGVILIIGAIGKWVWDRRKGGGGGGGGGSAVFYAIVIGATLSAPELIIPIVLKLVDLVANFLVKFFTF